MVKVVVVEVFLDFLIMQASMVFFECLVVSVLPLFVYVFFIKIVGFWRNKRTFHTTLLQVVKGKVPQPNMILDLCDSVGAQSVLCFSLDHLQRHGYGCECVSLPGL